MTQDIRWKQRFVNYQKALLKLSEAIELSKVRQLSELEKQGLIKAFEFTYELAWKLLKDFLEYQGETAIYGPRDAIKLAFEKGLIEDGKNWIEMITSRNLTVHTYNFELAEEIIDKITSEYFKLFTQLQQKFNALLKNS